MTKTRVATLLAMTAAALGVVLGPGSAALANPRAAYIGPGARFLNDPNAVRCVQDALGVAADGRYGQRTYDAVRALQARVGLSADGIVGPATGDQAMLLVPTTEQLPCYDLVPTTYYET